MHKLGNDLQKRFRWWLKPPSKYIYQIYFQTQRVNLLFVWFVFSHTDFLYIFIYSYIYSFFFFYHTLPHTDLIYFYHTDYMSNFAIISNWKLLKKNLSKIA
jgi:hypothetical protein